MADISQMSWFQRILDDPRIRDLAGRIAGDDHLAVRGVCGSSSVLLTAAISRLVKRPVLLVVAHLDDADEAVDELAALDPDAIAPMEALLLLQRWKDGLAGGGEPGAGGLD